MIKIFCDRCGKEITKCNRIGYIALNSKDQKEGDLAEDNEFEKNAYCSKCMSQIRAFIKAQPEESSEDGEKSQEVDTKCDKNDEKCAQNEKKCNQGEKKAIDIGKIMALKNAGWKNKDIAGEMHMEPQAVANAIYKYKKTAP